MDTVPRATNDSPLFTWRGRAYNWENSLVFFPSGEIDHRHNNLIKQSYLCVGLIGNAIREYPIEVIRPELDIQN